ncbi:MAG: orotate phosphoribosyltransferase [Longimicrobiales bacterium]
MSERDHQALLRLLRERSVQRGDFTLAGGTRSSYYIDARRTTMSGAGQLLIGRLGLARIEERGWRPDAVGGLTLGADPVAYAIAHAAARADRRIDAFTVRKLPKSHGTGRRVEGAFESGMDVVLVEDVVTSGGSAISAAEAVRAEGARVLGVLCVVDREEGGAERLREAGLELTTLATRTELLSEDANA